MPSPALRTLVVAAVLLAGAARCAAEDVSRVGDPKPLPHGTPRRMAPWSRGENPSVTGAGRWRSWVNPTQPRTPTWRAYSFPPGVRPGDWPVYAPLGFGGYRFPAVGNQAYR